MTTQAIQRRLPAEIDAIDHVTVTTGLDGLSEQGSSGPDVPPDVPF
ncbi:nitrogen-fixing NifU domain-containing protein [Natrinema limicola JCM 13563]|uniref:Nitrogen-fixing NifU domain-containing protein n=2 Tax=Natrinema TaxID=88723 RepID=M0C344_9EURY|nr:nitrogen-fixing NifU domain-containing protein [Natrinema limicola JCM 13563]